MNFFSSLIIDLGIESFIRILFNIFFGGVDVIEHFIRN